LKTNRYRHASTLLKIALSVACLWYALTKPDWTKMAQSWNQIDLAWVLVALGAYTASKLLASSRLNINFKQIGLPISETANRRLFWLGMLYNLLLPGAITGDAYKVMALGKSPGSSRKSLTLAVLLDRFSGLLPLIILLATLGLLVFSPNALTISLMLGSLLLLPLSHWGVHRYLPEQAKGFTQTLWMGTGVQLLVVATVLALILAMGRTPQTLPYLFVFLSAAALSVLPISVGGGLGIREFASMEVARYLNLPLEPALLLSLLFYGVTVLTALPGFWYIFKNPLHESK